MKLYGRHHIGQIGEKATAEFYTRNGYKLVTMNYRRSHGEIDVVVIKGDRLVFVEVKSVSCKTFSRIEELQHNPVENIDYRKRARLRSAISAFLYEHPLCIGGWQFDVAIVQVNTDRSVARVDLLPNVIL
jgi:putative endonuclease